MRGIVGVASQVPVNQLIYDALLLPQHRGQDAAGIVTNQENSFFMRKANGLVSNVLRNRDMRSLLGNYGIGQVRYPTAGGFSTEEAQPFYVNAPFSIVLVHNGNLTNTKQLKIDIFKKDQRHVNTDSDTEVLINVLAHEIYKESNGQSSLEPDHVLNAVRNVHGRVRGSYAVVAQISGCGLLAFRDSHGIRPLCIGFRENSKRNKYIIASDFQYHSNTQK